MKYLTILILLCSMFSFAQDEEGDLQYPVIDADSQIERQEEETPPPTIDEVEMRERVPVSTEEQKQNENYDEEGN